MAVIRHAVVYTPGAVLQNGMIRIEGERIVAVEEDRSAGVGEHDVDGRGLLLIPGLIDMQCNGLCGHDVLDGSVDTLRGLAAALPQYGSTAVLPTLVSAPREVLEAGLAAIAAVAEEPGPGARLLGAHMEGPWLSPAHHGAHDPAFVRPFSREELAVLMGAAQGTLRLVTLAPEEPGNEGAVAAVAASGAIVSLGHSGASFEQAVLAVAHGARMATHLFNAMGSLHHRAPGLAGAALDQAGLIPGIIPDGYHVHPAIVRMAARARGAQGVVIVTDSAPVAGLSPGMYHWQGREVHWDGETVRLAGGGLAGSGLTPIEALRRYVHHTGLHLSEALPAMTSTPARLLGQDAERGRIVPGARADLVLLTPDLEVHSTMVGGVIAYHV